MQDKKNDLDGDVFGADDFACGDEEKMPVAEKKKAEMSELLKKFKESAKEEQRLFQQNIDSEYWVAICFQNREQKEEFLRLAGWMQFGDKYLDGLEVAEKMGMKIGHLTPKPRKVKIDKTWKDFV